MKETISIKTDYSLLSSMIKIPDLILFALKNNIKTLGIVDDNVSSSIEFLNECKKNNIKPVIGLEVNYNNKKVYLYAKNEKGLKYLFKINTLLLNNDFSLDMIIKYITNIIVLLPYDNKELINDFLKFTNEVFIGYSTNEEKQNALLLTKNVVYFNLALSLKKEDTYYVNYLNMIKDNLSLNDYTIINYDTNYLKTDDCHNFTNLINIEITSNKENLIPHFDDRIADSYKYLESLAIKGLNKRLGGVIPDNYKKRLIYELNVIKKMNYVDYFLIVYDYVKYAIKNNIYVGPGRGSAAGSLVTYSLGITSIDPIKYNLLFERFLNPERISMPDIDIDFDASKRLDVINYVKERYGVNKVMPIMTYGCLTTKQALLSLSKIKDISIESIDNLIDSKKSLKDNLTPKLIGELNKSKQLKELYYEALKLENIKKHISTHAAGVVICKNDIDDVIPIVKSGNNYLTGYTMNYLENLGLLKMDFLAIKDLTTIALILDALDEKINLNNINLEDQEVLGRFENANTTGIFQFESEGMKNFLTKLKPNKFSDLVVALALFRPGPMQSIDSFIKRKEKKEKINYIVPSLEPILKETYGIIVYQEQIMQIFNIIASYSVAEADIIRRAISKKKEDVILREKENFISRAVKNNYTKEDAIKIYDLIIRFANYGFNKSHSVSYAFVGYQMMYLKVKYSLEFYTALLNINMGSISKTKEYIDEAKAMNITFVKPDVNISKSFYYINNGKIVMPLTIIKNIGEVTAKEIEENKYEDFYDFVAKNYNKSINNKTIETLVYAGAFDSFGYSRGCIFNNIKSALIYGELINGLDSSLVAKPSMVITDDFLPNELMERELYLYGYYISNHPSNKYDCPKASNLSNYFDKNVTIFVLLEYVNTIKTKNGDTMAFLKASDETGVVVITIFPKKISFVNYIKKGDFLKVSGRVQKRMNNYQLVLNNLEIIK